MPKRIVKLLDRITPGISRSLGWEVVLTGLSFPASILLNRALGAEDRGLLALVFLFPSTLIVLGNCQWDRLLQSLITSKQISGKEAWRRTLYYTWWLSLVFIPLGIATSIFFDKLSPQLLSLSLVYYINFPVCFLWNSLSAVYIATGSINGQYSMKLGMQLSYLILIFLALSINILSVQSVVIIHITMHLSCLLVGLSSKNKLMSGITSIEKPSFTPLVASFLPYLLESISGRIDTIAFSFVSSVGALGQYAGISALMVPVGLISNAMTSGSTARLDWTQPSIVRRYLMKTSIVLMCLLLLLVAGGILLGPYLLGTILGKSFESGYWMIPWIATVIVMQAASVQFHSTLRLSGYLKAYLTVQIVEAFVRIITVSSLGFYLSEFGIILGLVIASIFKIMACLYYQNKHN
jgi:O-antigen/teichoic acid export membrane protein